MDGTNLPQAADTGLMNAFQSMNNKNEIAEVLKELFDEKKIFMIGDLSRDEIKLLTRIYMIAELKNIGVWKVGIAFYCKLLLSRDRKSRREIIEAIKGVNMQQSSGLFGKMNPRNWGGRF